jgi:rsbT antagonist protein RsbS
MPVPILKQGPFLIASVRSSLSDTDWETFRSALLAKVGLPKVRGAVIDLTAMEIIDSYAARMLRDMAAMLRLRGAEAVIVGIQPDVAFAMAQLGLRLDGVTLGLDLDEGIEALLERLKLRSGHA